MGRRHRVPAQEVAVEGPGLLQGVRGVPQGAGPGTQGAQVHGRGHPAGAGGLRGGNATAEGPGAGRLACGPKQHVASGACSCHVLGVAGSGGPPQGTGGAVLQQQASSLAGTAAQGVAGVVLGPSGAGTTLLGTAPIRSRGGHGAHGPPRRPGGLAPWCSEWRRRHGAVPPRDRGRLGREALPPAKRRRCPPPGHGGEHGAVTPGVLHVQVEGRGRPGEVRRRLAPLGGGAVSREGMLHLPQPPGVPLVRPAAPPAAAAKPVPKTGPKPPPKRSPSPQYGSYTNIWYVLRHFGGELAAEQRGSKVINVCPWSRLDGAGHCSWRAGKHCRPAHLHPGDLLDHLQRDHGADPAQRDQARAMLAGVMPGGQAGPFASAQARSRTLAMPTSARPAGGQGASQSAAQRGADGSAATSSTGSTVTSASSGRAAGSTATSVASRPTGATSGGDPRGQGPSRQPPAPGAGGPPLTNDANPTGGPDPTAQP